MSSHAQREFFRMPRQHHPKFAQNQGRARPCTHPHAPGSHGEEPRPTARTPCRSPTHSHAASARSPSLPATSHPERHHPRRLPMEQVIVRCAPRTGRLFPHRRAVPRRLPRPLQVRQTGTRPATGFQKQTRTPQTVRRNDRGFSKIEGLHRNSWFCLRIHLPPKFVTRWGGTFSPK